MIITELIAWTDKMSHIFSPYVMASVLEFYLQKYWQRKRNLQIKFHLLLHFATVSKAAVPWDN